MNHIVIGVKSLSVDQTAAHLTHWFDLDFQTRYSDYIGTYLVDKHHKDFNLIKVYQNEGPYHDNLLEWEKEQYRPYSCIVAISIEADPDFIKEKIQSSEDMDWLSPT